MEEKPTIFDQLLSSMEVEDKRKVFEAIGEVYHAFEDYAERAGLKWLEIMVMDDILRHIFVCWTVSGSMWYDEHHKKEMEEQSNETQQS